MSTYLVTGGAGFIGSHIVDALLAEGHRVRVLDNFATGRRENLAHVMDKIELIEGDVRDQEAVHRAVQGAEYVLHQAALPSVPRSIKDPLATHEVNATGTLNILLAARESGVKRVVYASSSSVYGDTPELPKREDMTPRPKSPYAVSKLAGEHYCQAFWEAYGLETVCLRYFNVFGPRQAPDSPYAAVIPLFISALLNGGRPRIYGDGEQTRDFTFVANVVQANLLAATAPEAAGAVCNVACGKRTSLLALLTMLGELVDKTPDPVCEDPRPGDVRHSLASIEQAGHSLGYEPRETLQDGLRRTCLLFGQSSAGQLSLPHRRPSEEGSLRSDSSSGAACL
ncbi:MAG: SDR family oxidoreductase [Planctomycetota bacterium]|jgi:UDP-glucose 4-epimerase